eukprot:5639523-Pleurochrysis_carterae.AAC.1
MQRKNQQLHELHDVLGLRVVLKPTLANRLPLPIHWQRQAMLCYRALEVVHALFPHVPGRPIKDYVSAPKPNGYQSLHSAMMLGELRAEVQAGRKRAPHL